MPIITGTIWWVQVMLLTACFKPVCPPAGCVVPVNVPTDWVFLLCCLIASVLHLSCSTLYLTHRYTHSCTLAHPPPGCISEQRAERALGFTQASWDNLSGEENQPSSWKKYWAELTDKEKAAAVVLEYTCMSFICCLYQCVFAYVLHMCLSLFSLIVTSCAYAQCEHTPNAHICMLVRQHMREQGWISNKCHVRVRVFCKKIVPRLAPMMGLSARSYVNQLMSLFICLLMFFMCTFHYLFWLRCLVGVRTIRIHAK